MYNNNPHRIAKQTLAATTVVVSGPKDSVYKVNHYLNIILNISELYYFQNFSFYITICNCK